MAKGKDLVKDAANLPTTAYDYGEDAGSGFEELTSDDVIIPFLVVLQPLSPQVQEDDAQSVAGARPGMIYHTVTQELWDGKDGVVLVPCHRTHHFIEWIPRADGGGLVEVRGMDDPLVIRERDGKPRFGKITMENGHELIETFSMFSLLVYPDGRYDQVMQSFSSTQIRPYKGWVSRADRLRIVKDDGHASKPPLFAHRWKVTTRKQQNDKGTWYGWHMDFDGASAEEARLAPGDPLYVAAREFRKMAVDFATENIKRVQQNLDPDASDPDTM